MPTHKCPDCGCEFSEELIVTSSDAEEIYKLYPASRRIAKTKTIAAIKGALKTVPYPELKRRVCAFAIAWDNADMAFCPNSATWFGQKRFLDDPETWAPKQRPVRPSGPPTYVQIKQLEEAIATHPANPNWIGYDARKVTDEMRADLRAKRAKLEQLKQQQMKEI